MRFITTAILILVGTYLYAQTNTKHIWVDTYSKNGKVIQGHYRTAPNNSNQDNFSTKGNINPYTHKPGWITPDNIPLANPELTYKIDNSTKFSTDVEDCSGRFYGNLRIGQLQEILVHYKKAKTTDLAEIFEIKSTQDVTTMIALNPNGYMIGYIIETSNYNIALQILQNFTKYHSLPNYSDESGVFWSGEDYFIIYSKLDSQSQKIKANGRYRFTVSKN